MNVLVCQLSTFDVCDMSINTLLWDYTLFFPFIFQNKIGNNSQIKDSRTHVYAEFFYCLCAKNMTLKWSAYFRNVLYMYAIFLQTSGNTVCMRSVLKAHTCATWERRAMLKAISSPLRGLHLDLDLMEMIKHSSMCVTQEMTRFRQVLHLLRTCSDPAS